jgi:hypothetical protein
MRRGFFTAIEFLLCVIDRTPGRIQQVEYRDGGCP